MHLFLTQTQIGVVDQSTYQGKKVEVEAEAEVVAEERAVAVELQKGAEIMEVVVQEVIARSVYAFRYRISVFSL